MVSGQLRQTQEQLQLQFQHFQLQQQRQQALAERQRKPTKETIQQQFQQQRQQQIIGQDQNSQEVLSNQLPPTNQLPQVPPRPPSVVSVQDLVNSTSCVDPPFKCPHPRIQFFLYTRYVNDYEYLSYVIMHHI